MKRQQQQPFSGYPPAYAPPPGVGQPPGSRQGYVYPGQVPFYASQYSRKMSYDSYMRPYPYQQYQKYQEPPAQREYQTYAEQPYFQINGGFQPAMPITRQAQQHLPPKLKASAKPIPAPPPPPSPRPVYQPPVQQPQPQNTGPRETEEPKAEWKASIAGPFPSVAQLIDGAPPPAFDIIGRGRLPDICFQTFVTAEEKRL